MSNTKHTPGPWTAQHSKALLEFSGQIFINALRNICRIRVNDYGVSVSESNAKLIAAAPELLEALIDCVERVELDMGSDNPRVIKAKEAIKKATE